MSAEAEGFAAALRMERARSGLTQRELCARVGISLSSLSEIERGDRVHPPARPVAERLDSALEAEGRLLRAAGYRGGKDFPGDLDLTGSGKDDLLREIVRRLFRELRDLIEE